MIVRGPRPDRFTIVDNEILRNHALSFKARGLLAYLLSMPDNWSCQIGHLATVGPDGRDAVRTGLRELETYGYLTRETRRRPDGRLRTVTTVHDTPVGNPVHKSRSYPPPESGYPNDGKPIPLRNTYEEVPTKKIRDIVTERKQRLCTSCGGAGWTAYGNDVERCGCNPKVAEL